MSGIDNVKQTMGWKAPAERACCDNCKHVQAGTPSTSIYPSVLCGKAGFYTKRNAICNEWTDAVGVRG